MSTKRFLANLQYRATSFLSTTTTLRPCRRSRAMYDAYPLSISCVRHTCLSRFTESWSRSTRRRSSSSASRSISGRFSASHDGGGTSSSIHSSISSAAAAASVGAAASDSPSAPSSRGGGFFAARSAAISSAVFLRRRVWPGFGGSTTWATGSYGVTSSWMRFSAALRLYSSAATRIIMSPAPSRMSLAVGRCATPTLRPMSTTCSTRFDTDASCSGARGTCPGNTWCMSSSSTSPECQSDVQFVISLTVLTTACRSTALHHASS
mmetsp:Transcript_31951/g.98955  ORF Transcript_31951/g.98955 Transcript_31951/m.98955 type:complete len:265 (-) Transcript_31951:1504-2298(-)